MVDYGTKLEDTIDVEEKFRVTGFWLKTKKFRTDSVWQLQV